MTPAGRMSTTTLRSTILRAGAAMPRRHLHQTPAALAKNDSSAPDAVDHGAEAKGRTGGGEELSSSSNAPPKPKISNQSVPGVGATLSKEQKEEVDQHNKDFEAKHDRSNAAADDKVDKSFWTGEKKK